MLDALPVLIFKVASKNHVKAPELTITHLCFKYITITRERKLIPKVNKQLTTWQGNINEKYCSSGARSSEVTLFSVKYLPIEEINIAAGTAEDWV